MTQHTLHGRDRELARLDVAIGSGTDGLRFVRVQGAAGIGKSSVVAAAAQHAAASRGFEAIVVRGRAGSLATPLAPFAEAFAPLGQLLAQHRSTQTKLDLDQAVAAVRDEVIARAERCPLLLVIDDADALDVSSVALLDALATFVEEPNLTAVFIEQGDVTVGAAYAAFIDELGARTTLAGVALDALSDAAIGAIISDALRSDDVEFDAPVEPAPTALVERAGGNPWFALELAASWRAGQHELPRNIAAAAISRLRALPGAAQEFVQAIAVCPNGAHRTWLEGLTEAAALTDVVFEQLRGSGLVSDTDEVLGIAHPLMRTALLEDMSVARRRVLHRELAASIEALGVDEDAGAARTAGFHLAAGGRPTEAVARYLGAAARHDALGLPHEAHSDLVAALACETRVNERVALVRSCARAATYLGIRDAIVHWNELGRMAASIHDDELYAYALVQQYWASHDGTAVDRLRRAANLGADAHGWSARAAATLARLDGRLQDAIEHDSTAIMFALRLADVELEVQALEKLASSHALLGNTQDAIGTCRTAIARAIAEGIHDSAAISWGCLVETLAEELRHDEALAEARAADEYISGIGLTRKRPALLAWQASALIRTGDLAEAARVADEAVAIDRMFQNDSNYRAEHFGALVALLRADVANELGDAAALEHVDHAAAKIEELGYHSWLLEVQFERARAVARRDGIDAALPYVEGVEASGEPVFVANVARWLVRASVLADSEAGIARVRELREVEYAWTSSGVSRATCREIDATMAVLTGGCVDGLERVAAAWREAGRKLDALRVDMVRGHILESRGERASAREVLRAAHTGLAACGAAADVNLIAAALRRVGARSRAAIRTSDVGTLTQRELEIARHAASGSRNRDIAQALFITENTVTAHLTSIYDKTSVRSRVRLAQWLRDHDAALPTAQLELAAI